MQYNQLAQERNEYAEIVANPLPDGVQPTTTDLAGIPVLRLQTGTGRGAILYMHGGGYRVGSAQTGAPLAAQLGARSLTNVYALDYRLAPEHRYPAPVDDGLAAYRALLDDVDPHELVLAGDSAGAGLAVATLLAARDAGLPMPAGVVAFSGWFDLTLAGASLTAKAATDPIFTPADIKDYADTYIDEAQATSPLASPVFADLTGLPPLLLQVGSYEVLLDDSTRLAAAAAAADVDVTLDVYARQSHVFQLGWRQSREADRSVDRAADFIAQLLRAS